MSKKFKVLFWDLETLPDIREVAKRLPSIGMWPGRTFKSDINSIISFGYKFLGDKQARCINVWDITKNFNKKRNDDRDFVRAISKVIQEADVIVTHNGKKFDLKMLNSRLAKHGLPPVPKIIHVDTKEVAKNKLSLYSNSLDELAKFLSCTPKMKFLDKWDLWVSIMFDAPGAKLDRAKRLMDKYCKQDVDTLNEVFDKLLPHITVLPNQNEGEGVLCPRCGGDHLQSRGTVPKKDGTRVRRFHCQDCGGWAQQTLKKKDRRDAL